MHTMLRGTALLLGVIALLSGCEEVMDPNPSSRPPTQPAPPAKLYTEIGADQLIERWGVLPNGAVAEMESREAAAGYRLASATDGFSDLPMHFVFKDARKYGSCVSFTISVTVDGFYYDDNPNTDDIPFKEEVSIHVLDCVGEPIYDTAGVFHIAQMCQVYPDYILYIVRVGNAEPKINSVEFGDGSQGELVSFELVSVSISTHPSGAKKSWDDFVWNKHITPYPFDGDPIPVHWAVGRNWPHGEESWHDMELETVLRESTHMRFSIDDSHGVVKFEDNDGAAHADHKARCDTLPGAGA